VGLLAFAAATEPATPPRAPAGTDVIATGIPRPLQLAWEGGGLLVLGPGARGDAAGEVHHVGVDGEAPVDLAGVPPTRIPFPTPGAKPLGSLAVDPASGAWFMGEENGSRIWRRLGTQLALYAYGLRRLAGGSVLAFDAGGRLVVLDHADPYVSPREEHLPPGLESLRDEDYRGPLVLRIALDPTLPLPRRIGDLPPLYPRGWGGRAGGALLPHLISVASLPGGDLAVLSTAGQIFRLGGEGAFTPMARLPREQYNRTNMIAAPDGALYVSGGFHVGKVFRVSTGGQVTAIATNLADPAGIAVDPRGRVYVAESGLHRILRLR
jgi:hypothetical protein